MATNTNIREDALEEDILIDAPPFPRYSDKVQPIKLKLKIRGRGKPAFRFEDWEVEQMKDPEFRAAAEELEPEYQAARLRIRERLWAMGQEGRSRALEYEGDPIEDLHHILPEALSAEEWQNIIFGPYDLKERILELEAEVHALSTMLDCQWEGKDMVRHLRHRAQRALRCFASALTSDDPKAYAEAWGWTPQRLRKLVDDMYPPSVDLRGDKGRWEKVCKEWLKGCTCSSLGQQEECRECTKAFHDCLRKLAADEDYEELDSRTLERCICGEELDALGICKALPYY